MAERELLEVLGRAGKGAATLEECLRAHGSVVWDLLRKAVRTQPRSFDRSVLDRIEALAAQMPGPACTVLLEVAAGRRGRRGEILRRARALAAAHPGALRAAAACLREHAGLLGRAWIALARSCVEADPRGAWDLLESAAAYGRPRLLTAKDLEWMEARADSFPREYFRTLLSLAERDETRRERILSRALARLERHPVAALEVLPVFGHGRDVLRPALLRAVLRHLPAAPDKAWEFFAEAAREAPGLFDDAFLDALVPHAGRDPKSFFAVLHRIASAEAIRRRDVLDRFARLLGAHPAEGIGEAYYLAVNEPELLTRPLVDAVCAGFGADAYHAYDILGVVLERRPELLAPDHVQAALAHIDRASNWAFGFFRRLVRERTEFAPAGVLALFECLAAEPDHRAADRVEEIHALIGVAEASHVKTELERALRQPAGAGSVRARALLALLFRQRLRSKQQVLFEALRLAATATLWCDRQRTPLWEFLMFLLEHTFGERGYTAAAERFLEGVLQLAYLMEVPADHDAFRSRFAGLDGEPAAWPEGFEFLAAVPELDRLHRAVRALAARCGLESRLRLPPRPEELQAADERELGAIERLLPGAAGEVRLRLERRRRVLADRIAARRDPDYARAFRDPPADGEPASEARRRAARERRVAEKRAADALRAELARLAVEAVERARLGLYETWIERILGRKVDIARVDPSILPAFLFFGALGSLPNNRKWLARLVEDRIEGRPHDWMWTEPEVLAWKERVARAQPGVRFERWRGPFRREYTYRPADAAAERRRRIQVDLAQARSLLERAGVGGLKDSSYEELRRALETARAPREEGEPVPDARLLEEVEMNLERVRLVSQTPESDYEGSITLEVETDPIRVLFMGEYGFASCLSLRGVNVWSAVSNAIDVDKAVVWAKEAGGNVVGRRLIALTPQGVVSYRTYANRHGLALDGMFEDFIEAYALHCGTRVTHGVSPGPLLSDRWYDDGPL